MTEQLDLEDWLRDHPRKTPRGNGKSILAFNYIRLQQEVNEANYKTYVEKVKNDLLSKEKQQLKELLKLCKESIENYRSGKNHNFTADNILRMIDNSIGEKK